MTTDENRTLIRYFMEAFWTQGNLDAADEVIASPLLRGAIKKANRFFRTLFPDLGFTVEEMIAEEDKVVARWTMHGTYRPQWLGLTLSNRLISVGGAYVFRLSESRVKWFWFVRDELGLLRQLGPWAICLILLQLAIQRLRQLQ